MSRRRRLSLETPSGQVIVRDLSLPGARLVDIELPDGRRARLAEHLCGWTCGDPTEDEPMWATVADAVEAFTGEAEAGTPWIAVLEEYATRLGAQSGAMPRRLEQRLDALRGRAGGLYWDGPRPADGGGYYAFVGGFGDGGWVMEYGESPEEAARNAVEAAERALADDDAESDEL